MISAIILFFRNWLRLLSWIFFKPTVLQDYLRQIAPRTTEEAIHKGRSTRRFSSSFLVFFLYVLVVMVLTPFLLNGAVGLFITLLDGAFAWEESLSGMATGMMLSMALSLTWGLILGLTWGPSRGLALALGWWIALGVAGGLTGGISNTLVNGLLWGLAVGLAGGLAVTLESGVAWGLTGGLLVGLVGGLAGGIAGEVVINLTAGLAFGIAVVLGVVRLPFYLIELVLSLWVYRQSLESEQSMAPHSFQRSSRTSHSLVALIERSPLYTDELLILPQPFLPSLLVLVARQNVREGLRHIARAASNPFQRWSAQRALRTLLEQDHLSFFLVVDEILKSPQPYHAVGGNEYRHADNPYFTPILLLAEVAEVPPLRGLSNELLGFSDGVAHWLTGWLRVGGASMHEPLALSYLSMLTTTAEPSVIFQRVLPIFQKARNQPYGEEFYQTFHAIDTILRCQYLAEIARSRQAVEPLIEISHPLRPVIIAVFEKLHDVSLDAMVFLSGEHPVNLRDALLKAQGTLEAARRLTRKVYEPEHTLLLEVIEHWRHMFVTEGYQIVEGVEVDVLPNPYVAGRALAPTDQRLFVGRRDIFREIEETLHTGVTIVLYGQRRIGKTSILLHLKDHLSHTLLPVYVNLQLFQADTTAGLLFSLSKTMAEHLEKSGFMPPLVPTLDTFHIEPFLTFEQFLGDVERNVQLGQRIVLIFDEFEELEKLVNAGRVDGRIFTFLRGLTQTRHGFVLIFSGLHTLEQMSYDYWHPFFLSVKPIKVSYLSQTEAWSLITGPVDEFPLRYDKAATDRVIAATSGQPYLIQALCFNLVTYLNNPLHRSNRARMEHIEAMLEHTLRSGTYYFEDYFWGYSSADEQLALAAVAHTVAEALADPPGHSVSLQAERDEAEKKWVPFATIESYLGRETALSVLKSLCGRDILEERVVSNTVLEYRFQVELLRLWVARTKPLARILMEREGA